MLSVTVFLIPLITGMIAAFAKLKTDDEAKAFYQRMTFAGGGVLFLSLGYIGLGAYDLYKKEKKEDEMLTTINNLNTNTTYIKAQNDSYYQLLKILGIRLDTTRKEAKHNIDSLIKIVANQKQQLELKLADFNLCATASNLKVRQKGDDKVMNVEICNKSIPVHDVRLKYGFAVLRNGNFILTKNAQTKSNVSWLVNLNGPISTNSNLVQDVPIPYPLQSTDTAYFFVFGTFKDENDKAYNFRTIYRMDGPEENFSLVNEQMMADIRRFLTQKKVW